jgi:hypothetical protein
VLAQTASGAELEEQLHTLFKEMDPDGSDGIDEDELRVALQASSKHRPASPRFH